MNKIERIRRKIEALLDDWKYMSSIEATYRCKIYKELLEDFDSLQEESDYCCGECTKWVDGKGCSLEKQNTHCITDIACSEGTKRNTMQEEPASEDLGQVSITAADEDMQGRQIMEESNEKRQLYSRIFRRGFKAGANWQKAKDQEIIELAEDHAMLAGMNKMEEQMMAKAIRGKVSVNVKSNYHSLIYGCWDMDNALKNCNEGDKVKVIIFKDE